MLHVTNNFEEETRKPNINSSKLPRRTKHYHPQKPVKYMTNMATRASNNGSKAAEVVTMTPSIFSPDSLAAVDTLDTKQE